jgi:hypothetical protein
VNDEHDNAITDKEMLMNAFDVLNVASEKSLKFCRDLMIAKDSMAMYEAMPPEWQAVWDDIYEQRGIVAQKDVSKFINELKKLDDKLRDPKTSPGPLSKAEQEQATIYNAKQDITEDGIYHDGTTYFRVYWNLERTRLLCKELVIVQPGKPAKVKWVYKGMAKYYVKPGQKVPYEQAKEFGALYGICIYGHPLNDPVSIALGIGPICGERQFGGDFVFMVDQAKASLGIKTIKSRTRTPKEPEDAEAIKKRIAEIDAMNEKNREEYIDG